MVVQGGGGGLLLMSEVPLYTLHPRALITRPLDPKPNPTRQTSLSETGSVPENWFSGDRGFRRSPEPLDRTERVPKGGAFRAGARLPKQILSPKPNCPNGDVTKLLPGEAGTT